MTTAMDLELPGRDLSRIFDRDGSLLLALARAVTGSDGHAVVALTRGLGDYDRSAAARETLPWMVQRVLVAQAVFVASRHVAVENDVDDDVDDGVVGVWSLARRGALALVLDCGVSYREAAQVVGLPATVVASSLTEVLRALVRSEPRQALG
ncbi:hypothetical protein [Nocardioides scoriae]|nr:hypothetical protein [Nocardioides scoriae]